MADAIYLLDSADLNHSQQLGIEGQLFTARTYFSTVDGYWYIDLLDELGVTPYLFSRRLLPIGPWLTLAPADQLPIAKLVQLYDLGNVNPRPFPGALIAVSQRPLAYVAADADMMQLNYYSLATLATGVLT